MLDSQGRKTLSSPPRLLGRTLSWWIHWFMQYLSRNNALLVLLGYLERR
jgi:hypothetical protein